MDGTPLASANDLASWFPGVSPSDDKLMSALLEASNRFRGAVRHYVSRQTDVTTTLDGRGTIYLTLPVIELDTSSVTVRLDGATDPIAVAASRTGTIARTDGAVFPNGLGNVSVTYTAGFADDAIPPEIQAVVLDQAKLLYALKRGVQWLAVGGISMSSSQTDAQGVTQAWTDVVELYRIRVADRV